MKLRFTSFKSKLFWSYIIIVLIPLVAMSIFSYNRISNIITEKITKPQLYNIEMASTLIDMTMSTYLTIASNVAKNEEVVRIMNKKEYSDYDEKFEDSQYLYKLAQSALATQVLDVPMHFVDNNRSGIFSTTRYFTPLYISSRGNFYDIMDQGENVPMLFTHRRVDGKDSQDIVMAAGCKVLSGNKVTGYIIIDIYNKNFENIFEKLRFYNSKIYIVDKMGHIITSNFSKNETGFKFYEDLWNEVVTNPSGTLEYTTNGIKYKVYYDTVKTRGIKVIALTPEQELYTEKRNTIKTFVIIAVLSSVGAISVSFVVAGSISKPVKKLSSLMKKVQQGDRLVNYERETNDEIGEMGVQFNKMLKEINRLFEEVYYKQMLLNETELKALKAQINPHFLYNSLESINWMAKLNKQDEISKMTTALGKFLRYSISSKGDIVSVKTELEQIDNYLIIQRTRFKDKLNVEYDIEDDISNLNLPKLILQPLVENAIIYGIEDKLGKGTVKIKGGLKDNNLIFEIIDDGNGFENTVSKGEGIGLENVNKRIKLHYGQEYGVELVREGDLTISRLIIPSI